MGLKTWDITMILNIVLKKHNTSFKEINVQCCSEYSYVYFTRALKLSLAVGDLVNSAK